MKLYYDRKSKDPIYYIQQGIRNGKKTTTKNVYRIGKHSELLSITDDPLSYAKEYVNKYNDDFKKEKIDMTLTIDFSQKVKATSDISSHSTMVNVGYFILQKIYHDLQIGDFFENITKDKRITYDCNDINRFLTYSRVLDPRSKLGMFDELGMYYEKPDFDYHQILRFMDILADNYVEYIEHLFQTSNNIVTRDTSVCYFDCTNYYFETEQEDDDFTDEVTGEIIKGLHKYGPSKEHRPNPLVQMGLFMDGRGIPISMCINPGSDNEQTCAVPLEKELLKMFKGKKFIYCADAGLSSLNIRQFNSMGGRAFIVTQSIKKLSLQVQSAVFNDYDYRLLSNDEPITIKYMKSFDKQDEHNLPLYKDLVYKVIDVENAVDVGLYEEKVYKNGKRKNVKSKAILKQHLIITFSRKMMEYQRTIRNKQIQRAINLIKFKSVENIKKGPNDVTRFIKRTSKSAKGDTAVTDIYEIDEQVILNEEKYDGYYAIATNLDDDAKSIIEINSKRYKIEDCFRILKTNFRTRPVYHQIDNRIKAHFMICYTALLIYRLLEVQLDGYGTHFTTKNIIDTLKNMNVTNYQDIFYEASYEGSAVCASLNGLFDLGLDKRYYLPKDLNKKIKKISK